jgi:hypothetical protein
MRYLVIQCIVSIQLNSRSSVAFRLWFSATCMIIKTKSCQEMARNHPPHGRPEHPLRSHYCMHTWIKQHGRAIPYQQAAAARIVRFHRRERYVARALRCMLRQSSPTS